jgi:IclR family mhp operon transcriptional activator
MARSLSRGLQVIALLNRIESAGVAELARTLRVPRASLYRVLDTLRNEGFIEHQPSDQRYRLTAKVRQLSAGFSDDLYLAAVARPELAAVTRQLRWPVSLGMLSGIEVVVRASTDDESPLAADHFAIGYRMSVLTTATGLCVLAHLDPSRRDGLLAELARRDAATAMSAREKATLDGRLREIRTRGFCTYDRRRHSTAATSIAVPIIGAGGVVRGAVTLRFAKAAVTLAAAVSKFVPALREAAHRIALGAAQPPVQY